VHRISNKTVTTYPFPFSFFLLSTRASLSSQECKNSAAEYCCLVPFSLFPFFSSTWRGDRSDSEIDAAVQSNPRMPLIFSRYMHVESTQLGPAWDRHILTWSTVHDCTVSLILVNLFPSADASSSFWLVHGAVHAMSPPVLRSLEDMCNDHAPRVSSPALTSDQPLEYRKKEKTKYSYMIRKHLGLVWMQMYPLQSICVGVYWHET
jgi:hypothetical protein